MSDSGMLGIDWIGGGKVSAMDDAFIDAMLDDEEKKNARFPNNGRAYGTCLLFVVSISIWIIELIGFISRIIILALVL